MQISACILSNVFGEREISRLNHENRIDSSLTGTGAGSQPSLTLARPVPFNKLEYSEQPERRNTNPAIPSSVEPNAYPNETCCSLAPALVSCSSSTWPKPAVKSSFAGSGEVSLPGDGDTSWQLTSIGDGSAFAGFGFLGRCRPEYVAAFGFHCRQRQEMLVDVGF